MRIKLRNPVVVTGGSIAADQFRRLVNEYAGEWVDVETEFLFGDQFNVGVPNARIMLSMISDIEDDVRPMAAKCCYCGHQELNFPDNDLLKDCVACAFKASEGEIAYIDNPLCVMDRIRPLQTVENGKSAVIYFERKILKIKTPRGKSGDSVNRRCHCSSNFLVPE